MTAEYSPAIEINVGHKIVAMQFSANGEHLVSGDEEGIRVWQVEDGRQTAIMAAERVLSLAVSKDGRWIAAGTWGGELVMWDAKTCERVLTHEDDHRPISAVDFSPDSTRLVVALSWLTSTTAVWEVATRTRAVVGPSLTVSHDNFLIAVKYSPQGDRIATATIDSEVRVYDSSDGRLLVDIPVGVTQWWDNTGLVWSNDQLFIVSDSRIRQIESSSGLLVSEWPVPNTDHFLCILLPQGKEFIAYSAERTVLFWDTSTHTQLGLIQHTQDIRSISCSPNNQFLAIGGEGGKITIKNLRDILPSTIPFIDISDPVLDSWKQDRLTDTEASLTGTITSSTHPSHHAFASRALVRTHLRHWEVAVDDAENSIKIRPSVIGYIAKSVALIGGGKKKEGGRIFDFVFRHCDPIHVDLLLLIKAVVLFMAGEHDDAISRVGDLIAEVPFKPIFYVVQAYMYLLLGNEHLEKDDYQGAIQSFKHARDQMRYHVGLPLSISLISGWKCDNIGITIQQRLCEALHAAGHTKEGGESLLKMVNTFDEKVYTSRPITKWVSNFTRRYLSTRESDGNIASNAARHDGVTMPQATFDPTTTMLVVREWAKSTLVNSTWKDAMNDAVNFTLPRFPIYRVICECLETMGHVTDAIKCLQQMVSELAGGKDTHDEHPKQFSDFKQRCAGRLARFGDAPADAQLHDDAIIQYSTALSLNPARPQDFFIKRSKEFVAKWSWEDALDDTNHVIMLDPLSTWGYESVLTEWAKAKLTDGSWRNAFKTVGGFKVPTLIIYRAICELLETVDRVMDATECFHEMANELVQEIESKSPKWVLDFKSRCCGKLEDLGDAAMNTQQYDEAISQYSAALALNLTTPRAQIFVKRSKARAARGLWEDASSDANEAISLDPSSPFGYERKYVASRGAGHHQDTLHAFETMLLKMTQSTNPEIRERCRQYTETRGVVRRAIQDAIRELPRVLINTTSGRLCNKSEQATAFELLPVFTELISSMAARINNFRIQQEVAQYYRYATLSHKWEDNEPLFEKAIHIVVYDLEESPTHHKLQTFCKIVRDAGFHWAWSDTCCINKADHFVLQEALVAMFKWYQGSAVTIVFLRGVRSPSQRGDLVKSIWNTRAWTFQEYHASKVVRFYTEDWTPYMNLDIPNHKESPDIISEMEEATGVSARALMALRPGLDNIREKLCLASIRKTTLAEDAAYSLLGMFSASLSVVYGEGDKSLGRLLAQLLTSSGDMNILAWTGRSGSFNSCLPADITVFHELPTSHIPPAIKAAEMDVIIAGLRVSSLNLGLVMKLYDQLDELPVPWFVGQRMKLPCMRFKLGSLSPSRSRSERVFRAQTAALGIVEIRTRVDLSRLDSLYLIHPWIDFLLDRRPVGGGVADMIFEENTDDSSSLVSELPSFPGPSDITLADTQEAQSIPFGLPFGGQSTTSPPDAASLRPPSSILQTDKETRALRLIARLRQPFGALLVTPTRQNVAEYRRVASESRITVQVQENVSLNVLIDSARMLDML